MKVLVGTEQELNLIIFNAKNEVFDDIEDWLSADGEQDWRAWDSDYLDKYDKLKKKHLQPTHKEPKPKEKV